MKKLNYLPLACMAISISLTSCSIFKHAAKDKQVTAIVSTQPTAESIAKGSMMQKVADNAQYAKFITSKIKFQVKVGSQDLTLTGNLKMKRDDVIRLQLMAFGFVEAGRLEFTKDYVLIMDRINKQYLKASYDQLDFLRNSGLNFYSLQALFWNELFMPGKEKVTDDMLNEFEMTTADNDAIISYEKDKLSYRWLAGQQDGLIKMANIQYKDKFRGNSQLNWNYANFKTMGIKHFPSSNDITFTTPKKEVKLSMTLNYLGNESDWETRTTVSSKYKEVTVDDILRRFMAL